VPVSKDNLILLKKTIEDQLSTQMHMICAGLFVVDPFVKKFMRDFTVPERLQPKVTNVTRAFLSKLLPS